MKNLPIVLIATVLTLPAISANAGDPIPNFSYEDINAEHKAMNPLQMKARYEGQVISVSGIFNMVNEVPLSNPAKVSGILSKTNGKRGTVQERLYNINVSCQALTNSSTGQTLVSMAKGQKVTITGIVDVTILGTNPDITLENCEIS